MSTLKKYITDIVQPTFEDFQEHKTARHAFIAAIAAFHAIDRAANDLGRKSSGNLRKEWGQKSTAFKLIDIMAHQLKHIESGDEDVKPEQWNHLLSFGDVLNRTRVADFAFIMRDVIEFLLTQVEHFEKPTSNRAQKS